MADLRILLAPAAAGKTSAVREALTQQRGWRLVLTPNGQPLAAAEDGHTITTTTFYSLARLILRRAGRPIPRQAPIITRLRLLRRVVRDLRDAGRLPAFAQVATKPGFVAALATFCLDLGQSLVQPADLAAVADLATDQELAQIVAAYHTALSAHGLVDLPGLLQQAVAALVADPLLLGNLRLLALDGFDQFTPLQLRLLALLADRAGQTLITLTGEPRMRPAHGRYQRTLAELQATLPHAQLQTIAYQSAHDQLAAPLRLIERHLFELDPPSQPIPSQGVVQLIEAPDREREVRAVLRRVHLLLQQGADPAHIGLLLREPQPYLTLIDQVAREYQIPLRIEAGLALADAPVVLAFLALLRLPLNGYPRRDLLDLLRGPLGAHTTLNPDLLDALARSLVLGNEWNGWQALLEMAIARAAQGSIAHHAVLHEAGVPFDTPILQHHLAAFNQLVAELTPPEQASAATYAVWARTQAERLGSAVWGPRGEAARERLVELLAALTRADLVDGRPLSYAEFLADLNGVIGASHYQDPILYDPNDPTSPGAAGVAVLGVLAARGRSFAHGFLLGMSEGEFPRPLPEPAIYARAGRRRLQAKGVLLSAPDPADERTLFYVAATRARTTLTLSRTRLDAAGNALPRSPYLHEILNLLPDIPVATIAAGSAPRWDQATSGHELALALAAEAGFGQATDPRATIAADAYAPWAQALRAGVIEQIREDADRAHGPFEGLISASPTAAQVAALLGPDHRWSATEINDYQICGFRFAAAHLLRLRAAEESEPDLALDPAQRGVIEHAILAEAGKRWRMAGITLGPETQATALALLNEAANQILEQIPERLQIQPPPLWAWEREAIRRRIVVAITQISSSQDTWATLRPIALEQRFGGPFGLPPVQIETTNGPVLLQGQIDRIDQAPDQSLAVIDYKAGGVQTIKDSLQGDDVQLAIYSMAAEQIVVPGASVARATFVSIGKRQRIGTIEGPQVQQALASAQSRIGEVVAAARAGDFRVRPRKCPSYCTFDSICRKNLAKDPRSDGAAS